jgi:uncharacterized OB-fold protein
MANYNVPFHWRRYKERYRLLGTKCDNCGRTFFPLKNVCPQCRRKGRTKTINFSGKGKVYSYTVIRVPPVGFEAYTPYALGLIELDEGPKLMSQIVDCRFEDIYIGMPVEVCFRKLTSQDEEGIICYGFKFKPIQ